MAARTFAITLGAGLLLSACTGGEATDENVEDTGDTTDTGEANTEVDVTGAWNMVSSVYTSDGNDFSYTWPYSGTDADTGNTYNASITVTAAEDGTGAFSYAYSTVYADGSDPDEGEVAIGMEWTRTGDRTFDLLFDNFIPEMSCEVAEGDDNAMSCTGSETDGETGAVTDWTWSLTR
jgi:hypothetical protein